MNEEPFSRFTVYEPMEILRFIAMYKQGNDGNSPSIQTITTRCNISSTSTTYHIVKALEREGFLKRVDGTIHLAGGRYLPPPAAMLGMPIKREDTRREDTRK